MKSLILFATILICLQVSGQSSTEIIVLKKDQAYTSCCENMFVLKPETFASYYYSKSRLDSLLILVPKQSRLIDSIQRLSEKQIAILDQEVKLSNKQLESRSEAIEKLESTMRICIDNNEACITNYHKKEEENKKLKAQKKIWMISSAFLGGMVVILSVLTAAD